MTMVTNLRSGDTIMVGEALITVSADHARGRDALRVAIDAPAHVPIDLCKAVREAAAEANAAYGMTIRDALKRTRAMRMEKKDE